MQHRRPQTMPRRMRPPELLPLTHRALPLSCARIRSAETRAALYRSTARTLQIRPPFDRNDVSSRRGVKYPLSTSSG